MRIFQGLPAERRARDCALTIGNFDGVHRGHQALLGRLRARADALGLDAVACSFEPHPREWFAAVGRERAAATAAAAASEAGGPVRRARASDAPPRISTLRDKLAAMADCGLDATCLLRFDARLAGMSAVDFVRGVLVRGLRARHLLIGDDFRFGMRRAGDIALLRAMADECGYTVERLDTVTDAPALPGDTAPLRVSSSALREALAHGDLRLAQRLLGRPYAVSGHVLHGRKLGRQLGFPTLNVRLWRPALHALARPALSGVFAVRVHGLADRPLPGVASLGTRPAVERHGAWLLETHLFDFSSQVYGRCVTVEFVARLREERHYDSLDLLTEQIGRDARQARAILSC